MNKETMILKTKQKCNNELKQELGFKGDHPLVFCIRCLRPIDRNRFGLSICNEEKLKICSRCCNEEKAMLDKDWIEDLNKMRESDEELRTFQGFEEAVKENPEYYSHKPSKTSPLFHGTGGA